MSSKNPLSAGTVYAFDLNRAATGAPPLSGENREREIAKAEDADSAALEKSKAEAIASPRMTVSDLIGKLSSYPPDMPVMVPGFDEGGFDDLVVTGTIGVMVGHGPGLARHRQSTPDETPDVIALILNF